MDRVIFHCDLNSFYASVELLDYPQFRHLPVAVCGDPKSRQGIVLAKNDLAKAFGVATGHTVWEARRLCPELILLPSNGEKYRYYSQKANELYLEYSNLVEPYGVDESWIDVTGSLHLFGKSPVALADEIRQRCQAELGLTLSIGVSFNKIFAKLGSDYKKPNATTLITKENFKELVWPLPVGDLLFVGKASQKTLKPYGVTTIGALANYNQGVLHQLLGKSGDMLYAYANGQDNSPVSDFYQLDAAKSIGQGLTFAVNLETAETVRSGIVMLSDHVALRLRRHNILCYGVQLMLRDPDFHNISRQTQLENPTHLSQEISETAFQLAQSNWNFRVPVRAISVTAINLVPISQGGTQLSLFDSAPNNDKFESIAKATDQLREKYGRKIIGPASAPQKERRNVSIGFSLDQTAD